MNEHIPVLMHEVLEGLAIVPDGVYWDGTFGRGGHSRAILERLGENGRLFASDRDEAGATAAAQIDDPRFTFIRGTLETAIDSLPEVLTGILWDLGCSTPQLKDAERGFSFKDNGPLDMRMDQSQKLTAATLVNTLPEKELADLIYKYGEERLSRRIAARILAARAKAPLEDTRSLADICRGVYPRKPHRIDPATRTFQALRIAVNDELGQLERTLPRALEKLCPSGRAAIISFHSLEDRIVKNTYRDLAGRGDFRLITRKPLVASEQEASQNPASRSAKLRVIAHEAPPPRNKYPRKGAVS